MCYTGFGAKKQGSLLHRTRHMQLEGIQHLATSGFLSALADLTSVHMDDDESWAAPIPNPRIKYVRSIR